MSFELLDTAEHLLSRPGGATAADTCRAISTTYYALFHCLARSCCDLFLGSDPATRPQRAWNHLYRSFNHGTIGERCQKIEAMKQKNFDQSLIEFADFTWQAQWKRERCDYTYGLVPDANIARNDIGLARKHLQKYHAIGDNHKRAFAVYILVKEDRHEKKLIAV